ncbi:signal peptidase I [Loktanella sp. DJP18]|uniref:signal peptidase I n=1 Tax=Loktanella sp. DJP18 TaxID=3409788 RepID=UPI003BB65ED1
MSSAAKGFDRFNPIRLWVDGFDWFGRSKRTAFALVWLAFAVCGLTFELSQMRSDMPGAVAVAAILGVALLFVPVVGHGLRRLNDLGWSGWWGWLLAIPVVGVILALILCLKQGRPAARHPDGGLRTIGWAMACVVSVLIAGRAIWAPFTIVSEAMSPTLQPGDLIAVNTAARTYARGDVVVFRHPVTGQDHVMRLIGAPGDRVQMRDGQLFIDDSPVGVVDDGVFSEPYGPRGPARVYPLCANGVVGFGAACEKWRARETLPDGTSHPTLNVGNRSMDNTGVFTVPADHYFVMGDNRDNASDSRLARAVGGPGFVPRDNLVGRVSLVILSSAGRSLLAVWSWRWERILKVVT